MDKNIYIALMHYPVLDKEGRIITTAVTNMDLHDLARLARTYDISGYYVVQPLELQKRLVEKLLSYWQNGRGGEYNMTRKQAFERARLADDIEEVINGIKADTGEDPKIIGTSARKMPDTIKYGQAREMINEGGPWLILFGTGWGMEPEFLKSNTDFILEPVEPLAEYNHLSVRTAAAIIIDRLLGLH